MPFATGSANSFEELRQAVISICTANGYALSGNVLSKGSLFVALTTVPDVELQVTGGTGQAAGAITGQPANLGQGVKYATIAAQAPPGSSLVMTFPVTYDLYLHANPDEVFLVVNYQVNCYQYLSFGQSNMNGLPGTGNWFDATYHGSGWSWGWAMSQSGGGYYRGFNPAFFDSNVSDSNSTSGGLHHGFTDYVAGQYPWGMVTSYLDRWPIMGNSPSAWNKESVLAPIQVYARRKDGFWSMVLQMGHARWVMLDSLNDQQVISLGSDKWKVYPLWRRSARELAPTQDSGGTGTLGYALRYDGG